MSFDCSAASVAARFYACDNQARPWEGRLVHSGCIHTYWLAAPITKIPSTFQCNRCCPQTVAACQVSCPFGSLPPWAGSLLHATGKFFVPPPKAVKGYVQESTKSERGPRVTAGLACFRNHFFGLRSATCLLCDFEISSYRGEAIFISFRSRYRLDLFGRTPKRLCHLMQ